MIIMKRRISKKMKRRIIHLIRNMFPLVVDIEKHAGLLLDPKNHVPKRCIAPPKNRVVPLRVVLKSAVVKYDNATP